MFYFFLGYCLEWGLRIFNCLISDVFSCIFIIIVSTMVLFSFLLGRLLVLVVEIVLIYIKFRILIEFI